MARSFDSCLRILSAVLLVALGSSAIAVASAGAQTTEPVVVGVVMSLTGRDAAFGQEGLAGINIALGEANDEGGVHGRPITVQVYDDQSDPIHAADGVRRLVGECHPVGIIGSNTSMVTAAAAVAAQSVGVPLVVPEATNPTITAIGDWIYRVCFCDPDMAGALATYAYQELNVRRVAILTEEKHEYTASLTKYFRGRFTGLGGEIVFDSTYAVGTTDFSGAVRRLATSRPDAILVSGFYPEAGAVVAEARRQNLNVAFLGGDGWESDGLFSAAGDAITDKSRIYIASHFSAEVHRAKVRGFVDEFRERYGRTPITSSALGYDAMGLILSSLDHTADVSPAGLKVALLSGHHEGVTGHITVDASRNPSKKVIILQAKPDHHFAYVQATAPAQPANEAGRE